MKKTISQNVQDIYNLTAMQMGMLYHKLLDEETSEYVLQQTYSIKGSLDLDIVEKCLMLLAQKYDVLKTLILYRKVTVPRQVIVADRKIEFTRVSVAEDTDTEKAVDAIRQADIRRGFDFEKDSLLRVTAVASGPNETLLVWTAHHILFDGWCFSILLQDFLALYHQLQAGSDKAQLKRKIQAEKENILSFGDYVRWLEAQDSEAGLSYWQDFLAGYDKTAEIPALEEETETSAEMELEKLSLGSSFTAEIEAFAKSQRITLSTLLETVWGLVLQFYNDTDEAVFGKVVSGRDMPVENIETAVGLFINTIPVKIQKKPGQTIRKLLKSVQEQSLKSGSYHFCSLAEVQKRSELGQNLFRTIMVYENFFDHTAQAGGDVSGKGLGGLEITAGTMREQTSYPVTFKIYDDDGLVFELMYDPSVYSCREIRQVLEKVRHVMKQVIEGGELKADALSSILPGEERSLEKYNQTASPLPIDQSIIRCFEKRVAAHPEMTAMVFEGESWSYTALNQRINRLAHHLRNLGIKPGDRVGLFLERSAETVIGMMAVLKAGGAYIPIETDFPLERIRYILEDSCPKAMLTAYSQLPVEAEAPVLDISLAENFAEYPAENPAICNSPDDTAYIIYTSGTTGKPKGVMISHRNVLNCCLSAFPFKDIRNKLEEPAIIATTNYVFDIFGIESLMPLLTDQTILLANRRQQEEQEELIQLIGGRKNLVLQTTPSKMKLFTMEQSRLDYLADLSAIILGGEPLSGDLYRFLKLHTTADIYNIYGPTETTIWVASDKVETERVVLGRPMDNVQLYVLDQLGRKCGFGVPGELCIAGDSVGQGYLNRPELTAEKFRNNPFGGGKIYYTGDRARWLPDGQLGFLERMDDQVKIRGFRIELEEIASVIRQASGIKEALVTVQEADGEPSIAAYLISDAVADIEALRSHLQRQLPGYMIPAVFMQIDTIPVNANGKLDRKALPKITAVPAHDYTAPAGLLEEQLTEIFEEVLGVERLGIHDDFFEMGAHSLLLTKAMNLISRKLEKRIPLRKFFDYTTVAKLREYLEQNSSETISAITKAEALDFYPVTPAQRRMFVLHQANPEELSYNMPTAVKIVGRLEPEKVQRTFQQIIDRHENLRTTFHIEKGEIVQFIAPEAEAFAELESVSETITSQSPSEELFRGFLRPFDLTRAPLMRVCLLQMNPVEQVLLFDMHHIISDAVTLELMISEFIDIYDEKEVFQPAFEFRDYSQWFNQHSWQESESFWKKELSGELPILELPLDFPRLQKRSHSGRFLEKELDDTQHQAIAALAKRHGATEYMVFLTAFYILMNKYSRQSDILVGTPVSGRTASETEKIWGLFVNTIVLRGRPEKKKTLGNFLDEVKETLLTALNYQEYPFEELVNLLDISRSLARNPLFDVMFTMQKQPGYGHRVGSAEAYEWRQDFGTAKFDLTMSVLEGDQRWRISFDYCADLFTEESISYFLDHYIMILDAMTQDMEQTIQQVSLLTEKEEGLLAEWNQTEAPYEEKSTISQIFSRMAKERQHKPALLYHDEKISYLELDRLSNQVAHALRQQGARRNTFIPLLCRRGPAMIIGMLGIIKSGAAYVPIDPDFPAQRIDFIVKDCGAKLVLSDQKRDFSEALCIDLLSLLEADHGIVSLSDVNQPEDRAYCIYTSGTTGQPKGSVNSHQNVMALKETVNQLWGIREDDVCLQFANFVFDASVLEIVTGLLHGLPLCLVTQAMLEDPQRFNDYTAKMGVTIGQMPTQYLPHADPESFRLITTGGSVPDRDAVRRVLKKSGYINAYGPTEATVAVAFWRAEPGQEVPASLPIGRPVANAKIYILDELVHCGIGVPGELCVTGPSVGLGYLNRRELSEKVFPANPFGTGKMYRTGDLARFLPDGNIEYLGRMDRQVKIRGFRIELDEVTAAMKKVPQITDAVVIAGDDQGPGTALYAYYLAKTQIPDNEIRHHLSGLLPDYMIPSYFMRIPAVPVAASGKVDTKALPAYKKEKQTLVLPETREEEQLAGVLAEVLGLTEISLHVNFFEVGGDSIKAIRIVSRLREKGYELSVKSIMEAVSLKELAGVMLTEQVLEISQKAVEGEVFLTPIQQYFFKEIESPAHFNQAVLLDTPRLKDDLLIQALEEVVKHHDQLRSIYTFDKKSSEAVQKIAPIRTGQLCEVRTFHKLGTDEAAFILQQNDLIQRSMDLSSGPLLKGAIYHGRDCDRLFLCCHHLVIDGVSWRIILGDLQTAYLQLMEKQKVQLPQKTVSYQEWASRLQEHAKSKAVKEETGYWRDVLWACGRLEVKKFSTEAGYSSRSFVISKELTRQLLRQTSQRFGAEVSELLLSALALAVKDCFRKEKIALQLEGHGREEIFPRTPVDRTVGWFTSVFPVLLEAGSTVLDTIIASKETLRRVPKHGVNYGVLKYLTKADLPEVQLDIAFNYLGEWDETGKGGLDFAPSQLSAGESAAKGSHLGPQFVINSLVRQGELVFDFTYPADCPAGEIKALQEAYRQNLEKMIREGEKLTAPVRTSSDYGVLDISETAFQKLTEDYSLSDVEKVYDLTPMQKGILYHKALEEEDTAYVLQQSYRIRGALEKEALQESLRLLGEKYEVLKSAFPYRQTEELKQLVLKSRKPAFSWIDLGGLDKAEQEEKLREISCAELKRGFDLEKDSLFRVTLIRLAKEDYHFLLSAHHIIIDGWCFPLLMRDYTKLYRQITEGADIPALEKEVLAEKAELPEYKDYVSWLKQQDEKTALSYWSDLLAGYEEPAGISPMKNVKDDEAVLCTEVSALPKALHKRLKDLCKAQGITLSTLLETAWGLLLQYCGQTEDAVFGKVVSGRNAPIRNLEQAVGLYINTIPVRVKCTADETIAHLLQKMKQQSIACTGHDFVSLMAVQEQTGLGAKLASTLFAFENYPMLQSDGEESGLVIEAAAIREETSFDLTFVAYEAKTLVLKLLYQGATYDQAEIKLILDRMSKLLQEMADHLHDGIKEIQWLTAEEQKMLGDFNDTALDYDRCQTAISLFDGMCALYPDRQAVVWQKGQFTYQELKKRAEGVAGKLQSLGVGQEDFVAIYSSRRGEMLAAILGVMKAGGAYVPLDPLFPAERLAYILDDCRPKVLLYFDQEPELDTDILKLSVLSADCFLPENYQDQEVQPSDLAYAIYTSGTTGHPKGVLVEHQNLTALNAHFRYAYDPVPEDRILQFGNFVFDVTLWEFAMALLNGGALYMAPADTALDAGSLRQYVNEKKISKALLTPPLYQQAKLAGLELMQIGGAQAAKEQVMLGEKNRRFMNLYGPTEGTVISADWALDKNSPVPERIPIGKPIRNTRIYILRGTAQCGIGVKGEICIAGAGVARGYKNLAELTAQAFIPNPFGPGKLYRSGDLGRWLADGNIEYLGRIDKQVKIRGFRIELEEVKSRLRQVKGVRDTAVIVRDGNEGQTLAAFFTAEETLDTSEIKKALQSTLPSYMVPSFILQLESIPLNFSHKVDEKQLMKKLAEGILCPAEEASEPETSWERTASEVFAEVLGQRPARKTSFFDSGGDSLKAMRLSSAFAEAGFEVSVKTVYQHPTIELMGEYLHHLEERPKEKRAAEDTDDERLDTVEDQAYEALLHTAKEETRRYGTAFLAQKAERIYPLSATQEVSARMGILHSLGMFTVSAPWDKERFRQVWYQMQKEASNLRSAVVLKEADSCVIDYPALALAVPFADISGWKHELQQEIISRLLAHFEIFGEREAYDGSQLSSRLLVLKLSEDSFQVLLPVSHLLFDGFSSEILRDRVTELYRSWPAFPSPRAEKLDYKDYADALLADQAWADARGHELTAGLGLEGFAESAGNFRRRLSGNAYKKTALVLEAPDVLSPDKKTELLQHLYQKALAFAFPGQNIPLLVIRNNRSQEYAQCIGEFADLVPVLCGAEDTLSDQISRQLAHMREEKIVFAPLLADARLQEKCPDTAQLIQQIDFLKGDLPMLNILSMYEMSSVIADEKRLERYFVSDEEEMNVQTLMIQGNRLILTGLLCPEGREEELGARLQRCIREL